MAIKVIKHGKKAKFTKVCPVCGCEFEYEVEDLETDYSLSLPQSYPSRYQRFIKCPDCGERIYHDSYIEPQTLPKIWYGEAIPCKIEDPCKDCDFHKRLMDGKPYIGDTPCEWCQKNPWKPTWTGGNRGWTTSTKTSYVDKTTFTTDLSEKR